MLSTSTLRPTSFTQEIAPIVFSHDEEFETRLDQLLSLFRDKETEHNWSKRDQALLELRGILKGGIFNYSNHQAWVRRLLVEGILISIHSLRTQLCLQSCLTIRDLAATMNDLFEPFLDISIPGLIKVCSQTKKIVAHAAADTILAIIESLRCPRLFKLFEEYISVKNKELRRFIAIFVSRLTESLDGSLLENFVDTIEACLSKGLIDASSEVRLIMRDCYRNYSMKFPELAQRFRENLDITTRKHLDQQPTQLPRKDSMIFSRNVSSSIEPLEISFCNDQTQNHYDENQTKYPSFNIESNLEIDSRFRNFVTSSPKKISKEYPIGQSINQNPTDVQNTLDHDEHSIFINLKSNMDSSVDESLSDHRSIELKSGLESFVKPLEDSNPRPLTSEKFISFVASPSEFQDISHNATPSFQLLHLNSFLESLARLRRGPPSYSLINELICLSKNPENPMLDVWFVDIYNAVEEFVLQNLIDEGQGEIMDQLEDGLIVLKIFLKHHLYRFDSLLDRVFKLLFRLHCHHYWMVTCISEDLWCLLIENHGYLKRAFDFLLFKLNTILNSSNMESSSPMSNSSLSCVWSLLSLLTSHLPIESLEFYLQKDLVSQFIWTIRHPLTEVRKSFVDFIVVCYSRMGIGFEMYMTGFTPAERKLIQIYMDRKQE